MIFDLYSIIGWVGMILIILAYFLLSTKKLKSKSIIYHLLNLLGGAGIIVSAFTTQSWPAMILNIIWMIIAVFSIYKIINVKPIYKELK